MARIRSLKPEMWQSETFGAVSIEAQALFVGLITQADDEGRIKGTAARMRAILWPYKTDLDTARVEAWLDELQSEDLVTRYEVGGKQYLALPGWLDHQKIDRPSESKLPAPHGPDAVALANAREDSRGLDADQGPGNKDQGTGSRSKETASVEPAGIDAARRARQAEARELFAYWQERCEHPNAKFTSDRKQKVEARLRDGYTVDEIRAAIEGAAVAPFINPDGKKFDDLELICRSGSKLEGFKSRVEQAQSDKAEFLRQINARRNNR